MEDLPSVQQHFNPCQRLQSNVRSQRPFAAALMIAASTGKLETVRLLLNSSDDKTLKSLDGETALMSAISPSRLFRVVSTRIQK